MAISDAMRYRMNTGGSAEDLYATIRDFLAASPDAAATQAAMRQYGISGEDVANATGGKSGGLLSGNVLAGASWNSLNTALPEQLTAATGQATSNYAVGGATTTDTLNQLNTFLAGGGQFDPTATVFLQTGGVDFIQGVDKGTIKDNINQIVKTLADQGVNVVLTGSPYAASIEDVVTNNFDPKVDSLFTEIAKENNNVALVGTQGEILQNKRLLVDALHTNAEGTAIYNQSVIDALSQFKNTVPDSTPQAIAQVQKTNVVATSTPIITQAAANPVVAQSLATQSVDSLIKAGNLNPTQIAAATGVPVGEILTKVASTVPQGQTITLGDTIIAPEYRVIGSGEDQQIGNLETIYTSKTTGDPNYRAPVGSEYQQYNADGTFQRTGTTQAVAGSFLEGLGQAITDPVVLAALAGGYGAGLFGGAGLGAATAGTVGTTGLTVAELAQLDLALGGAGGTAGAETLAAALTTGAAVPTLTNLTGGSGVGTLGVTGANGAFLGEGVLSGVPAFDAALATAPTAFELANAGAGAFTPTFIPPTTTPGLLTPSVIPTSAVTPSVIPTGSVTPVIPTTGLPSAVTTALTNAGVSTAVNSLLGGGGSNLSNLFSGGLGTAGNLLQMQQSREAAQQAQARIDAETAAAKAAAQFRPIGMTTRFGTSQFQTDPVTGQLISAGYTLSPEAKAQQDRFIALSQQGLTQAEASQQQFAPLQTGAQRLFGLGNQYLAQTPQDVAQNYLNQQMALLQPGREQELATLQNRLQQQGRGGLSVAQGGTMGATTPELQALYNARAQQEAQLAANAQQYGQQQVAFGAGLLGQGAGAMGQYYGGQQAAYAPYTTAMGQVQGLEALGQQPFTLGTQLGQTASAAGARVGQLGLEGARLSAGLATSADATRNLGAQSLIAAGNPNAMFGQAIGGLFGGGLQSAFGQTGLGASGFGTGLAYGNQDLGLYL